MLCSKFDQTLHELSFAAWLQGNFQAAQSRELRIDVAYLSRATSNPVEHLEQFLMIPVPARDYMFQQNLQSPGCSPEPMNRVRVLLRQKAEQGPFRLLEYQFRAFSTGRHRGITPLSREDQSIAPTQLMLRSGKGKLQGPQKRASF
jgi:hypothetical protein